MRDYSSHYKLRDTLVETLTRDLVGCSDSHELLFDTPTEQYVSGVLFPLRRQDHTQGHVSADQDSLELDEDDPEEGQPDPPVALANVKTPSSMGLTFAVADDVIRLRVRATGGCYKKEELTTEVESRPKGRLKTPAIQWRREPFEDVDLPIDLRTPYSQEHPTGIEGLYLFARVRKIGEHASRAVTLVLVNRRTASYEERNENAFFQVRLEVTAEGAPFVERPSPNYRADDKDFRSYRLLYRDAREFAVGHGCSVEWDTTDDGMRATRIATTFVPAHEVLVAESNPAINVPALWFSYLTERGRKEVCQGLNELASGYKSWIAQRTAEAVELDAELKLTAAEHLKECRLTLVRMRLGIRLLMQSDEAWEAFRLMNLAMRQQRSRTDWIKSGKKTTEPANSEGLAWFPFQLAFILICIRGSLARTILRRSAKSQTCCGFRRAAGRRRPTSV